MKKYAKISFILVLALMVTTISAFAATRSVYRFDTTLPANQGDEELEPVARDSDGSRFLIGFSTLMKATLRFEHGLSRNICTSISLIHIKASLPMATLITVITILTTFPGGGLT